MEELEQEKSTKEKSKFEKVQNRWLYLSGDFDFSQAVLDN